jgi:hypothetical protein
MIEWWLLFQAKELLEQNQLSLFVDQKLSSNYDSAELEEMVQIALLCSMYRPCHCPKMSEIVRILEGGDGVAEKWEAMKNIEKPNPDWSLEFMWIGINYYENQCNSIELQAIELSGVCVHAGECACMCVRALACGCVHVCMCYVLCVLGTMYVIYSVLDFQIGKT